MRRLVFDQSSPLHPVSESRGGTLSVTHGRTDGGRTEILVSNIGCLGSHNAKNKYKVSKENWLDFPPDMEFVTDAHTLSM